MNDTTNALLPLPSARFDAADFPSASRVLRLPEGGLLVSEGEQQAECCWLVLEGELEVCLEDAAGHETTLYHLGAGELVGEMSLLGDIPRSATVTAARDSRLLQVSRGALAEAMQRHEVLLRLASHCFVRYRSSHDVIRRLSPVRVSHRIVHYLLAMPEWRDVADERVTVRMPTHAELARLLACQRESITRAFRVLRAAGAIEECEAGMLLRRDRLERILMEG